MEGAFATLLVYAFAMLIAIILLGGASKGTLIASGVLFVTAIIVNQLPIIPHMYSDGTLHVVYLIIIGLFFRWVLSIYHASDNTYDTSRNR